MQRFSKIIIQLVVPTSLFNPHRLRFYKWTNRSTVTQFFVEDLKSTFASALNRVVHFAPIIDLRKTKERFNSRRGLCFSAAVSERHRSRCPGPPVIN